jgi:hypothetical protein
MIKRTIRIDDFRSHLREFVGKAVKKVGAGGSTGSVFSLEFTDDANSAKNFYMMVKCAWRLDYLPKKLPLTSWQEDSSLNGVMTIRLQDLVTDVINKVVVSDFGDLELYFQSEKRLSVFCDLTSNVIGDTNWFFGNNEGYFSINHYLNFVYEPRP